MIKDRKSIGRGKTRTSTISVNGVVLGAGSHPSEKLHEVLLGKYGALYCKYKVMSPPPPPPPPSYGYHNYPVRTLIK